MTVYLGKNPVGVGRIVEKEVAKEKFGCSVDSFLGSVDADGNYVAPSEPVEVNLAGVKSVPQYGFYYGFSQKKITKLLCNDVTYAGAYSFSYALTSDPAAALPVIVEFNSLEEVSENSAFAYFCAGRTTIASNKVTPYFNVLRVISGPKAFTYFGSTQALDAPSVFPALEEITGNICMETFCNFGASNLLFPKVKKITGGSGQYQSTFGYSNLTNSVWKFPEATEFSGYIWLDSTGTSKTEIHFAAANQAAIEACEGYDYKWGMSGATIYFDL